MKKANKSSRRLRKSSSSKNRNEKKRKLPFDLPIHCLNVFFQPRQTFRGLLELAESINHNGLMHPLSVARFSKEEMKEHLRLRNLSQKQKIPINIEDLKPCYQGYYYVLIAGERRYRAIQMIIQDIEKAFRKENTYTFSNKKIECHIYKSPSFFKFMSMQLEENITDRPPAHEEAEYIDTYFNALKIASETENKKLSITGFAKKIHKSPGSIRSALKFSELPEIIKKYVSNNSISYGVACEIARLKTEIRAKASELKWWANIGIKKNVKEFKALIDKKIEQTKSGSVSFFEEASTEVLLQKVFKKIMEDRVMRMLYTDYDYLKKVLHLFETKEIGNENSAFNNILVIKRVGNIVEILNEKILPHLQALEGEGYFKKCLKDARSSDLHDRIEETKDIYKKVIG